MTANHDFEFRLTLMRDKTLHVEHENESANAELVHSEWDDGPNSDGTVRVVLVFKPQPLIEGDECGKN